MKPVLSTGLAAATLCLVASCVASSQTEAQSAAPADSAQTDSSNTAGSLTAPVRQRLDDLQAAVDGWQRAGDLDAAKAAAETARNLVTGPDVNGYGDLDGDGRTGGASTTGLLPGEQGQPGLITSPAPACVERDVLGGSWADPSGRWQEVRTRVAIWSQTNNPFPALPSHPQRVVGWASLTLAAPTLELAREYAGHAQLHVRITREALNGC